MTTSPVITITDENLAEIERDLHQMIEKTLIAALLSERAELKRRVEQLEVQVMLGAGTSASTVAVCQAQVAAVIHKASELKRDAERYRWLVEGKRGDYCWYNVLSEDDRREYAHLDAAIDAAMTQ